MYKACIFDMDGTILNTLDSIAYFGNMGLAEAGLKPLPVGRYKSLVGNGVKVLLSGMVKAAGGEADNTTMSVISKAYNTAYENDPLFLITAYDGIEALLKKLKRDGVKLAVLSNKPDNVTTVIAERYFPDMFDIVYGQRDGVPRKPDPTALNEMIATLGVRKEEILYIGDSGVDMETAKNGEVTSCGVLWGFRGESELRESGAVFLAKDAAELEKIIYA